MRGGAGLGQDRAACTCAAVWHRRRCRRSKTQSFAVAGVRTPFTQCTVHRAQSALSYPGGYPGPTPRRRRPQRRAREPPRARCRAHRAPRRVRRRFRRGVGGRGVLRCLSAREPTPVANCDLQIFVGIHLRRRRVTSKISGTSPKLLSILYTSSDQATGRFTVLLGAEPDCPRSRSRSRRKPPGIEEREIARDTP